jgi:hypothetical protein
MAFDPTTGSAYPNLLNLARRTDPDGKPAKIVELLAQTNEVLDDAYWIEGNLPTGNMTTVRSDIPKGTWRRFNYGVRPIKSNTAQVTDVCGMLEARHQIDCKLASINGNDKDWMLSEATAILEGMNQDLAATIFYGDITDYPDRFNGLSMRYEKIGTPTNKPTANNYLNQVINNGGVSSSVQASIWLIGWGPNTVHMFYPKGSAQGVDSKDLGEVDAYDADGGVYRAYAAIFSMTAGITVRDWRYIVRIANVDVAAIASDDAKLKTLYRNMITAINTIPSKGQASRLCFYMNRAVKNLLDIAATDKANAALKVEEIFGKQQTAFWGIPIKQVDSLLLTESVLS